MCLKTVNKMKLCPLSGLGTWWPRGGGMTCGSTRDLPPTSLILEPTTLNQHGIWWVLLSGGGLLWNYIPAENSCLFKLLQCEPSPDNVDASAHATMLNTKMSAYFPDRFNSSEWDHWCDGCGCLGLLPSPLIQRGGHNDASGHQSIVWFHHIQQGAV